MELLLKSVVDLILEGTTPTIIILFLLFASFLYALSQASVIYDFVDKFNKRELTRLKELLADDNISENAKITLRNKLDLMAYQKTTGIKINNIYLQEQVIHYYKLAKGRLRYSDFKRAALFLSIDSNDILEIRQPYWYEKVAHIYWTISSVFLFIILSFFIVVFVYFSIPIKLKIALSIFIFSLVTMLLTFMYQASLLPAAKRIKKEIENNFFIVKRNKAIIKARQTDSTANFHPLAHLSTEESQNRIKDVLGAWQNEPEIDAIFAEIDRDRHSYRGRQIDSLDD